MHAHRLATVASDPGVTNSSMTYDADYKIIVGRVLDVDDIISFHGESVAEFEANFHAVIDGYVSACEQLGTAPEKPASGKLIMDSRLLRG